MSRFQLISRIAIHVVAWVAVLSLPFLLRPDMQGRPPGLPEPAQPAPYAREMFFLVQNGLLIAFFYLNYAVIVPRFLTNQRRRWAYLGMIVLCFLVFQVLIGLLQNHFMQQEMMLQNRRFFQQFSFVIGIFLFGLAWAASSGIRLNSEWRRAEERRRESETERLKAELSQLKSQLNPHFLFNTLNGIYSLTLAKTDAAADAVLKLSHLLRYVMAETKHHLAPLDRDLEHLQHFVALHQLRLTPQTPVSFSITGDPSNKQIAPLLLLPFVENAFKFGSSTREWSPVSIDVQITDKKLVFSCRNFIRNRQGDSSGIGISNTRRRLDLLYAGNYTLDISEQDEQFEVLLQLNFTV